MLALAVLANFDGEDTCSIPEPSGHNLPRALFLAAAQVGEHP